ncbi:uncharacterized protein LOC143957695 [Lithobates pipiens]
MEEDVNVDVKVGVGEVIVLDEDVGIDEDVGADVNVGIDEDVYVGIDEDIGVAEDVDVVIDEECLRARYSRYVPVTLCVVSLTSLIIIIALSAHLSLVAQQYDETSITLAMLQQENEHLSSNLTFQPEEALRQTNEELETKSDQERSQEEQKTNSQNLERTMQEEVETGTSRTKLEDNICNTGYKLQEKTKEPTRHKLKKSNVNSPSKKEANVLGAMSILQQIQSRLHESQRNTQKQLEMLNNIEERLSELEDNLKKLEDKLSEQCNQVESLGE